MFSNLQTLGPLCSHFDWNKYSLDIICGFAIFAFQLYASEIETVFGIGKLATVNFTHLCQDQYTQHHLQLYKSDDIGKNPSWVPDPWNGWGDPALAAGSHRFLPLFSSPATYSSRFESLLPSGSRKSGFVWRSRRDIGSCQYLLSSCQLLLCRQDGTRSSSATHQLPNPQVRQRLEPGAFLNSLFPEIML